MKDTTNVMLCGFGGQGVVLAGVILGNAAVNDGLNAAQAASYGSEARGSACRSEVIVSKSKIVYPHIRKADILGVMSQQGYDKFHPRLKTDGLLAYDSSLVKVDEGLSNRLAPIPATDKAVSELDTRIAANIVFLAAIASLSGVVSREALEKAVRKLVPQRFLEVNLRALEIGWNENKPV